MKQQQGFTLTELITVVAIVGILAAIVYPSYQEQINKSRRSDAHISLMDAAQQLERCYTQFNSYNHANCPAFPSDSFESFYRLSIARNNTTYTLTATAQGVQSGDGKCTTLTLAHTGQQNATGSASGECWP